jgi:undecaprenyl pyrophosphate phosphatase UppP
MAIGKHTLAAHCHDHPQPPPDKDATHYTQSGTVCVGQSQWANCLTIWPGVSRATQQRGQQMGVTYLKCQ